jgi:hypothetical protein
MYAEVDEAIFDPACPPSRGLLRRWRALFDSLPGARGSLAIEVGDGRRVVVRLWDSAAAARGADPTVNAAIARFVADHIRPLALAPLRRTGGHVLWCAIEAPEAPTGGAGA